MVQVSFHSSVFISISWLFHTLSFEMKFRISISSYKTTNHKKTKKVLDRFSLNLCMNLETIGIFTVLSFFLQGRNIHFIYSGLLLCCHGIFQLIWYSAHAWMKNRMEDLYKLILRRVCVRMTQNVSSWFLSNVQIIISVPLNVVQTSVIPKCNPSSVSFFFYLYFV